MTTSLTPHGPDLVAIEPPTIDALLADGTVVTVRPVRPGDAAELIAFHESLSPETQYRRFFTAHPHLGEAEAKRFTEVDHCDREALVVCRRGRIVGIGRYDRTDDAVATAEVAFTVHDAEQGLGIGSLLLEHLADLARARGFHRLVAMTLGTNTRMSAVFAGSGFVTTRSFSDGVIDVSFDLDLAPVARPAIARREHQAEVASMARLLRPASVVVVSDHLRRDTVARDLIARLESSFSGPVLAVEHPTAPGSTDVETPTLAILTVGWSHVLDAIAGCVASGIDAVVVTAAGPAGPELAEEWTRSVRDAARAGGMRLVGPGSSGIGNFGHGLDALLDWSEAGQRDGVIGLATQSGAVARVVLRDLARAGLGASSCVTLGAKADVSGNDLLQFWADDPAIEVALLELESFGNAHKFGRLAQAISPRLPIVALRAGSLHDDPDEWRTTAGLLSQHGVIDVGDLEAMIAVTRLLVGTPRPAGTRVAVLASGYGFGVLARDACHAVGLTLSPDRPGDGPPGATEPMPPDVTHVQGVGHAMAALEATVGRADVDAVMVVADLAPEDLRRLGETAHQIGQAAGKPIVVIDPDSGPYLPSTGPLTAPFFSSVSVAATALAQAAGYESWCRSQPDPTTRPPGIDESSARRAISEVLCRRPRGGWLDLEESRQLLSSYGIGESPMRVATDRDQAMTTASTIGFPVELRCLEAQEWLAGHDDLCDRRGPLSSAAEVGEAWDQLLAANGPAALPLLVVPWPRPGARVLVRVEPHRQIGAVLTVLPSGSAGGTPLQRVLPLGDDAATALTHAVFAAPEFRAQPEAPRDDGAVLRDLFVRIATLAEDHPEISAVTLDPIVVSAFATTLVSARVELAPAPGRWNDSERHLRR